MFPAAKNNFFHPPRHWSPSDPLFCTWPVQSMGHESVSHSCREVVDASQNNSPGANTHSRALGSSHFSPRGPPDLPGWQDPVAEQVPALSPAPSTLTHLSACTRLRLANWWHATKAWRIWMFVGSLGEDRGERSEESIDPAQFGCPLVWQHVPGSIPVSLPLWPRRSQGAPSSLGRPIPLQAGGKVAHTASPSHTPKTLPGLSCPPSPLWLEIWSVLAPGWGLPQVIQNGSSEGPGRTGPSRGLLILGCSPPTQVIPNGCLVQAFALVEESGDLLQVWGQYLVLDQVLDPLGRRSRTGK